MFIMRVKCICVCLVKDGDAIRQVEKTIIIIIMVTYNAPQSSYSVAILYTSSHASGINHYNTN